MMRRSPLLLIGLCLPLVLGACSGAEGPSDAGGSDDAGGSSDAGGSNDAGDRDAGGSDGSVSDGGASDGGSSPAPDLGSDARIILLHHSTGGRIWDGGVAAFFDAHNQNAGSSYAITEMAFPHSPYPWANYPYDYWHLWVENGGNDLVEGQETLEILSQDHEVIVFKHCYPVSHVEEDSGSPDVSSSRKSRENYELQYAALKAKLHEFPQVRFVLWTGAALVEANTNEAEAIRAQDFFGWVRNTWDEPGDNIYLWDLHSLETEGGLYLAPTYATSSTDSHPNATFSGTAAPLFGQRVIDVITGYGDLRDVTGLP